MFKKFWAVKLLRFQWYIGKLCHKSDLGLSWNQCPSLNDNTYNEYEKIEKKNS